MQRLNKHEAAPTSRDSGAVAVIFALCLVMLIGFVGLGVDVAAAYAKSQEAQNGADAAALAVAQSCAKKDAVCPDSGDESLAQDLAEKNVRLEVDTVGAEVQYPAPNQVKVTVEAKSQNFFVPVVSESLKFFTVREDATAEWITPTEGPATLPLTVSGCNFFTQAGEPILNQDIYLWLPKGKETFAGEVCKENYPPGGFGWLPADGECETDVELPEFIVVNDPGADRPACVTAELLELGEVFLIPIFDDYRTTGTGNNAEYGLARYAALKLVGYSFQEGGATIRDPLPPADPCPMSTKPAPTQDYRNSCLKVQFIDWVDLGEDYSGGGGPKTEVSIVTLVD